MNIAKAEAALWIGGGLLAAFLLYQAWQAIQDPDKALKATGQAAGKAVLGVGQGAWAAVGVDSEKLGQEAGGSFFDWLHPDPKDTSASALARHWVGDKVDRAALTIDGVLN